MKTKLILLSILLLAYTQDLHGQWVPTKGPYGGEITCFAMSGADLFVGTYRGGIFRSTDSGLSWSADNTGLPPNTYILALAASNNNLVASTDANGIFTSTDRGASWFSSGNFNSVQSFAAKGTTVFASTLEGVAMSTNDGVDWAYNNAGLPYDSAARAYRNINGVATADAFVLASPVGNGVYRRDDTGSLWRQVGLADTFVSILESRGSTVFAVTDYGLFRSTDAGTTWSSTGFGNLNIRAIATNDVQVFVGTLNGIFVSNDNGNNWVAADHGLGDTDIYSVYANELAIFVGTYSGGVFRSTDNGSNWASYNTGIPNTFINAFAGNGSQIFAGSENGLFMSSDGGNNWMADTLSMLPQNVISLSTYGRIIFASTSSYYGNHVYRSTDGGESWSNDSIFFEVSVKAFAKLNSRIFAATNQGIFLSTDSGETWKSSSKGLGQTSFQISDFTVRGSDLFANADEGGIYLSSDSGSNWLYIGLFNSPLDALGVLDSNIFVGAYGQIYHSNDNGKSWDTLRNGLPNADIVSFIFDGQYIFAGTDGGGVYLSTNKGISWIDVSLGLQNTYINIIALFDSTLYAGTAGAGIWRRPLSEMIPPSAVSEPPIVSPTIQSFPNPFTQSTTIQFTVPASGEAEVTVVNLLGTEVARLFSGELAEGPHSFTWNAGGMAPGMYECLVRMNGTVERQSMMLLP